MAKQFAITTNKTTFYHFAMSKKEAVEMAQQICKKFAVNYGDTVVKVARVSRRVF